MVFTSNGFTQTLTHTKSFFHVAETPSGRRLYINSPLRELAYDQYDDYMLVA
jgi:hypothetical protein